MKTAKNVLQGILEDAHQARLNGKRVLTVFDLDSTLFDLTTRVQKILDNFAIDPAMKAKYPQVCLQLANARIHPQDWGIKEALNRAGLLETEHPDFFNELHETWAYWFFSDHLLHEDLPLPGAVEFVRALEGEGADIMYLTGRDVPRMWKGTVASLKQWNFPLDDKQATLVLKPDATLRDAPFKLDVLMKARTTYDDIWFFENEPVNLNLVQKNCPDIRLVFIETTHSGREQISGTLDRIPHFEVDLAEFAKFKETKR